MSHDDVAGTEQDHVWLLVIAERGRDTEKALEALFRKYRRPLLGFLMQRNVEADAAEDIVQEVFIRVLKAAGSFRAEAKVSSWIFQIARNLHIDMMRRPHLEDTIDEDAWTAVESLPAAMEAAGRVSMSGSAHALEDCFDHGYRAFTQAFPDAAEALDKVVRMDWSIREVALFLERTEGATREYLSQCRKKLKRFMQPCQALLSED